MGNTTQCGGVATIVLTLLATLLLVQSSARAQEPFDFLIRGGRLLDGTGNPWRYADVAIRGNTIVAIGKLEGAEARRVIDATDLYVAPGFIDTHSHAGSGLASAALSHARPLLAQGITTVFVNPDGGGPVDLRAQREALLRDGLGVNVAQMIPHGSIRRAVMRMRDRPPTEQELQRMRDLVQVGMNAGGFGLSSGLYYAPGSYAQTAEVLALARVAAGRGGVYQSHLRDEADYTIGVVAALEELIEIADKAGIRAVATHIKALGPRVWGYSAALIERIERARAAGIEVYADQYPYEASSTGIVGALVPRWAQEGGWEELQARLREDRERFRSDVTENLQRRGGGERLTITTYEPDTTLGGRNLAEIAADRGMAVPDLVLALLEQGDAGLISHNMIGRDIEALMRQPWTMTASDGSLVSPPELMHPRGSGTFPRKIRLYAVERGVVRLEDAVRSMTALPAAVYGVAGRGQVREGATADLAVFDLKQLADRSTFDDPHRLASGMRFVLVNGTLAIDDGEFTGAMVGEVLARRR